MALLVQLVRDTAAFYDGLSMSSFYKKLERFGVLATLESSGPTTVFAPTDRAISSAEQILATLSVEQQQLLWQYHMVQSSFLLQVTLTAGSNLTSANGEKAITIYRPQLYRAITK